MPDTTPTVVIVGRPNVGKSTLFNRITGQRRAIVGDEPGITRDRMIGSAEHDGRRFELIDTGGIVVDDHEYIPSQILHQARSGAGGGGHIIFLVDGRGEITGSDRDLARMLQRLGKPVSLAVNKADTAARDELANDFYELGIPDVFPVSAEHGTGWTRCSTTCWREWSGRPAEEKRRSRRTCGGPEPEAGRGDQGGDHRAAERRANRRC